MNRILTTILFISLLISLTSLFVSCSVQASGFFPEPAITDDPNGNIHPKTFYEVACQIYDLRKQHEHKFDNILGGVTMYGQGDQEGYTYYFYLQDVIDMCEVLRAI